MSLNPAATLQNVDNGFQEANGPWVFNEEVATVFDDMLARSIPGYRGMRALVHSHASACLDRLAQSSPSVTVLDIGASRGEQSAPLIGQYGGHVTFHLSEMASAMAKVLRSRFYGEVASGVVVVDEADISKDFPSLKNPIGLCLAVLTLQFIPVERRMGVVKSVYDNMEPGGAFILVEKVLGSSPLFHQEFTRLYHQHKERSGYTQEAIRSKAKSLEGVLVPLTEEGNQRMLAACGFSQVECFWRNLNFAGWLAFK
jgi:tRNA (cmo5U34)-methyltransferase